MFFPIVDRSIQNPAYKLGIVLPVINKTNRALQPSLTYTRTFAREERVVDWSSVGTLEEGLELHYGPRKDWKEMDDTNRDRCSPETLANSGRNM